MSATAWAGQVIETFLAQRRLSAVTPAPYGGRVVGSAEDREAEERTRRARILSERSAAIRERTEVEVDPPRLDDLSVLENLE
jgi:hypothetical protein